MNRYKKFGVDLKNEADIEEELDQEDSDLESVEEEAFGE